MKKLLAAAVLVLATALPAHATSWDIGFRVTTIHPTNVAVHYTVSCRRGDLIRRVKREFIAQTPLTRSVAPTLENATSCHIVVRAWDVKPHVWQHNWPAPKVTSWVNT